MTSPSELGELFLQVSRRLRHHQRTLSLAPHQGRALRIIAAEPIRPARLAETLRITPRAVTDVVDTLIAEQLVTVGADPADRRAKIITITDHGRERLERARAERREIAAEFFQGLSPADRAQLAELLQRLLETE